MRRVGLLHSCLALLVIISLFSFGLFVSTPKEVSAFEDLKEGDCSQCHTDGRKAPGQSGTPAEPAKPADPAKPAEPAQPTEPTKPTEPAQPTEPTKPAEPAQPSEPTQPAQPTPAEPVEAAGQNEAQKVNNTLPIVGLAGSVIVIGGAAYLDRRKKQ